MNGKVALASLVVAAMIFLVGSAQDKSSDVTLRVVKYEGLKDEVLKNRGKVVLIDFWADYCVPCKKAFPHTVELHEKFQSKGLAVISCAVDSLDDNPDEVKDKLLRFLKKQNAGFTNLLLDEPDDFWQTKLRSPAVPFMYVFNRQGKWTQLSAEELEKQPKHLERLIEELLAEK